MARIQKYSLVQQPRSLASTATQTLTSWIASQPERLLTPSLELLYQDPTKAEHLISRQIEITRNYLESYLPKKIHNTLAIEVIEKLKPIIIQTNIRSKQYMATELNIIGRIIETLFTKNLTCLLLYSGDDFTINTFFKKSFRNTVLSKSYMITNLVSLSLRGIYCLQEIDLMNIFKDLHYLRHLSFRHCTHNVITCLVENCKLIEDFESWQDKNIDENSMGILTQLPSLRSVTLMQSSLTQKGVETLLLASENIELKITCQSLRPKFYVERSLENIASFEEHNEKQFNLINYKYGPDTVLQQLQMVVKMCPLIKEVHIYNSISSRREAFHFSPLNKLEHLRELNLRHFDFYGNRVFDVLQRGSLVRLSFDYVNQIDLEALMRVSQMCPNLETLSINHCCFVHESFHGKFPVFDSPQFKKLKRLSLRVRLGNKEQLIFLLSSCPSVEYIDVNTLHLPITDDLMLEVLNKNPMIHLKEMTLACHKAVNKTKDDQDTNDILNDPRPSFLFTDRIIENCLNPPEIKISFTVYIAGVGVPTRILFA